MELRKVTLQNVRLFDHKVFEFEQNSEIAMRNEGGKSTLADAITFLLIGKLYSGTSDLASLKPVKDTKLEVSVEAEYQDENGRTIVLKKVYAENWVKTRGTSEQEMKGHNTTCYINEEKLTVSNYESVLCGLFDVKNVEELNIMLNPYYFSQNLDWKTRLAYVKRVTGEITPEDVLDTEPLLSNIRSDIESYPIEALRNRYRNEITDKKDQCHDLEVLIKGYEITETVSEKDFEEATEKLSHNRDQITSLRVKEQGIKNPVLEKLQAEKQKLLEQLNTSAQIDNAEMQKINDAVTAKIDNIKEERDAKAAVKSTIDMAIRELESSITLKEQAKRSNEMLLPRKKAQLSGLAEQFEELKKSAFTPSQSLICPNCGHDLSAEANKEAERLFNQDKADRKKRINEQGLELNKEISEIEANNKVLDAEIEKLRNEIEARKAEKVKIAEEINRFNDKIVEVSSGRIYSHTSDATKKLRESLAAILASIAAEEARPIEHDEIMSEIKALETENEALQRMVNNYNAQQTLKAQQQAKEKELIKATELLSKAENRMDLLTLYSKTYLEILTARLDMHFPGVKFKMVEENIKSGSWNETCYIMIDTENGLVPYETANTANKIKIGVKLANQLAEALGWKKAPMIIDNCEAITKKNRFFETAAQIITLVADDVPTVRPEIEKGQIALEI